MPLPSGGPVEAARRLAASPYVLLVLTMLFWAGNAIAGRWVVGLVPPVALNFWRWFLAALLILPFAWRHLRHGWPAIAEHWMLMAVLACLSVTLFNTLYYLALNYTTAINVALVGSATPAVIPLVVWIAYRGRLSGRQAMGLAASAAGVLLVITRGNPWLIAEIEYNRGDLVMLAAVAAWSAYSVLLRRAPTELHPLAFAAASFVIGLALALPFYVWELAAGRHMTLTADSLIALAYIAVFPSCGAFVFWNRAVAAVGPSTAGLFIYLVPVFVAGLAVLLLGERVQLYHLGGIALIFGGIRLATRNAGRRTRVGTP